MARGKPLPETATSPPEVIIFDDPDKRAREKLQRFKAKKRETSAAARSAEDAATSGKPGGLLSVKLRKTDYHDMLRYGISNLKGEERKQARIRLAVELGAKPPKKGTGNFKNFLTQLKNQKEEKRKNTEENQALQQAIQKSKINKSKGGKQKFRGKKRGKNEVSGAFDGQIGSYKRGVQTVSKRDFGSGGKRSK